LKGNKIIESQKKERERERERVKENKGFIENIY